MAKALDVAMYLVHLRDEDVYRLGGYVALPNMKLQKLMFYCHGVHYALADTRLITDEAFAAWKNGPSIARLYNMLSHRGNLNVPKLSDWGEYGYVRRASRASYSNLVEVLSDVERKTLELVWQKMKYHNGFDLADATRSDMSWKTARANGDDELSDDLIRESFLSALDEAPLD